MMEKPQPDMTFVKLNFNFFLKDLKVKKKLMKEISDKQVKNFYEDGVVFLEGYFHSDWIKMLRKGINKNLADPGERKRVWDRDLDGKFTLYDSENWQRIDEYRAFIQEGPTKDIALKLLQSKKVNFFFEAIFVRSEGVQFSTPWHQDEPYWSVKGFDTVSIWMPLVDVDKKSSLAFVPGSHRWDKNYIQQDFGELNPDNEEGVDTVNFEGEWEKFPDIDSNRHEFNVISWDMKAGDCVAFNARIIHGGGGKLSSGRDLKVFNTQWLGKDVRVNFKPYGMDPDHSVKMKNAGMNSGDKVDGSIYPEFTI